MKGIDRDKEDAERNPRPRFARGTRLSVHTGLLSSTDAEAALEGPWEKPKRPVIYETPTLGTSKPSLSSTAHNLGLCTLFYVLCAFQTMSSPGAGSTAGLCLPASGCSQDLTAKSPEHLPDLRADPAWKRRWGWRPREVPSSPGTSRRSPRAHTKTLSPSESLTGFQDGFNPRETRCRGQQLPQSGTGGQDGDS